MSKCNDVEMELIRSIHLSPIASILTDARADNPIIAANSRFEHLTGYAEQELLGRNCRILAGPETAADRASRLRHGIATATPTVVELINYRKDGSRFLNAVMVAPIFDADGHLAYFLGSQMEVVAPATGQDHSFAADRIARLTSRQKAVLRLIALGKRNRQIGEDLGLTEKTIKMHRVALVKRLGVATVGEAMRLAIQAGL